MTRILADLPDDEIKWLDETATVLGRSHDSLVSEAVAFFRGPSAPSKDLAWLEAGFGLWKDRADIGDAVEWQRRERASWTRPWDDDYDDYDDYDDVKAEFPDLFDAEDDRQRQIHLDMLAAKYPDPKLPEDQGK